MIALVGAVLAVSVIAACVGQIYYCGKPTENYDYNESTIDDETPRVHIKISQPHQDQSSNDTFSDTGDSRRYSIDSNNIKEMKQVVKEAEPVSLEETQIVPVKPPSKSRRISTKIWSRALRRQLESITDSSSEMCCTTKIVQAQIEANPAAFVSNSQEASEMLESKPSSRDCGNSPGLVLDQSHLSVEKGKKISSVVANKLKSLKRTLICSRTEKSMIIKGYETDETERLNLPASNTHFNQRSLMQHSTLLRNSRLDNVSSSTRISANISEMGRPNEASRNHNSDKNETRKQPESGYSRSNNEELEEAVSLIKRQSVNGKSVCDVRISGLTMNQSELLDLFEATRSETRSASIITTKEASIISIKFHRQGNSSGRAHSRDGSFFEGTLNKIYKSLPEGLSPFNVFRSQERPGTSEASLNVRNNRTNPAIKITDHSSLSKSRNETSYMALPKIGDKIIADNPVFDRGRSISKRYSSYSSRFSRERQM